MTAVDFKDWYDKYFRMVYLFLKGYLSAKQISHSEKEVEDLVQNTFLSILERKSDKPIEFPAAYLKKTAISQVRIYYQRKNRVNFKEINDQFLEKVADHTKYTSGEKEKEEQQILGLLGRILNHLESRIVFKRVIQEYSYKEIAQQENIANEKHLHVLYYRAKIKLYNYFKNIK